jgi:hypothetical protein
MADNSVLSIEKVRKSDLKVRLSLAFLKTRIFLVMHQFYDLQKALRDDMIWQYVQGTHMPLPTRPDYRSIGMVSIVIFMDAGKSTFLSYIFVCRFLAMTVTSYCIWAGYAHVFTNNGGRSVSEGGQAYPEWMEILIAQPRSSFAERPHLRTDHYLSPTEQVLLVKIGPGGLVTTLRTNLGPWDDKVYGIYFQRDHCTDQRTSC